MLPAEWNCQKSVGWKYCLNLKILKKSFSQIQFYNYKHAWLFMWLYIKCVYIYIYIYISYISYIASVHVFTFCNSYAWVPQLYLLNIDFKIIQSNRCWKTTECAGHGGFFWRTAGSWTAQDKQEKTITKYKNSHGSSRKWHIVLRFKGM